MRSPQLCGQITPSDFNPWWGCTKIQAPDGERSACDHCYAADLAHRWGFEVWGNDTPRRFFGDKHWAEPIKWNKQSEHDVKTGEGLGRRHRVFCASMGDVFENRRDLDETRTRLFDLIERTPWLDWQLLTKRPEAMPSLAPWSWRDGWPSNVWAGTTVETQRAANLRVPRLLRVPASVRFLSIEPLFERVSLRWAQWVPSSPTRSTDHLDGLRGVHWVIVGGESGPKHQRLDVDDARALRDECVVADVAFFFKQHGGRTPKSGGRLLDGRTWDEFPTSVTA